MRLFHGSVLALIAVVLACVVPVRVSADEPGLATPTATPIPGEHVVQRGEYLSAIAYRYGVTVEQIAAANNLANPRLIHAGVHLRIPSPDEPLQAPAPVETEPVWEPPAEVGGGSSPATYVVVRGDYLSAIAARYGVSAEELAALNSLDNPSLIHAGMVLTLPPSAASLPAPDARPTPTVSEGKQIAVVLSQQKVYAFENGVLVQEYLVSTGLPATPTVQGDFAVYRHVPGQLMQGSDYYLPNVQWVMYFYRDYALHGTYWHSNYGRPMSHGCVNMRNEDAEWLYNWAPDGTSVRVLE